MNKRLHKIGDDLLVHMVITEITETKNGVVYMVERHKDSTTFPFFGAMKITDADISENMTQTVERMAEIGRGNLTYRHYTDQEVTTNEC